jgi:acetyltransferase
VAIARYARTDGQRAELAVVVQDDYQRLGLGRLMLDHLIALGRRNGIVELHGETLTDNTPMLNLLRSTGLPLRTALTGSVYRFRLELGGAEEARAEE